MAHTEFLGVYYSLPRAVEFGVPSHPEGIWQVWRIADGDYMAQPIDKDMEPCGEQLFVLGAHFSACFSRMLVQTFVAGAHLGEKTITADAPDLLDYWFNQLANPSEQTEPSAATDLPNSHLMQESFDAPPPADAAAFASTTAQEDKATAISFDISQCHSAEELEAKMRATFADLLVALHEGDEHTAIAGFEALLSINGNFTSNHKFMFSEFGLALRREKLQQLAMSSHLRALECAPNDEHVLFNIARTDYELGNAESAKERLRKALALYPEFTAAKTFLEFLSFTS